MAATLLFLTVQTTNGHRNPDLIKGWPLWVRETYPPTEVGKWSLPDLNPQKLLMLRPSMPQAPRPHGICLRKRGEGFRGSFISCRSTEEPVKKRMRLGAFNFILGLHLFSAVVVLPPVALSFLQALR